MTIYSRSIAAFVVAAALSVSQPWAADAPKGFAPPAHEEMTDDGPIFVTNTGMTLYTLGADNATPGKSTCTDKPHAFFSDPTAGFGNIPLPKADSHKSCAQKWPPLTADATAFASGDWTIIDRPEGVRQWSYRGHPLYT